MYEKLDNCPLCQSESFENVRICKDYLVSGESFVIVECSICKFQFTNPRPSPENNSSYYQSEEYVSHSDKSNTLINRVYKLVRLFTLRNKRSIVTRYAKKGKLLDVGCGTGDFLKVCNQSGWIINGMEPDPGAAKIASEKLSAEIGNTLDDIGGTFEAITLWHVLEHIHELDSNFKKLLTLLSKEGTMFVAVPNRNSYDAKLYKSEWAAYDVPRHLYHFTEEDIKRLAKNNNAKVVDTLPMKLDSYYVSMLSEKNLSNGGGILKAIKVGAKSNREAKINSEYSSKIYVIQHK